MIIYQNEVYSYMFYLGCVWMVEGIVCFNWDYLVLIFCLCYFEVKFYLGMFNINCWDYVEKILFDGELCKSIDGIVF